MTSSIPPGLNSPWWREREENRLASTCFKSRNCNGSHFESPCNFFFFFKERRATLNRSELDPTAGRVTASPRSPSSSFFCCRSSFFRCLGACVWEAAGRGLAACLRGERVAHRLLSTRQQRSEAPAVDEALQKGGVFRSCSGAWTREESGALGGPGARGRGPRPCHPARLAPSRRSQLSPPLNLWSPWKVALEESLFVQ